jgi:hypothetical protein
MQLQPADKAQAKGGREEGSDVPGRRVGDVLAHCDLVHGSDLKRHASTRIPERRRLARRHTGTATTGAAPLLVLKMLPQLTWSLNSFHGGLPVPISITQHPNDQMSACRHNIQHDARPMLHDAS